MKRNECHYSTLRVVMSGFDIVLLAFFMILILSSCQKESDFSKSLNVNSQASSKKVKVPSKVKDKDGNWYSTISIGTQTWLGENLRTTKYSDGTPIQNVTNSSTWANLATGAYCDYDNNPVNSVSFGRLYNWYAVASTNPKNLCPSGWHVASDADWVTLTDFLGGESIAGGKLKESGLSHWISPNEGATNESGFSALPGGARDYDGTYYYTGVCGFWWLPTEFDATVEDDALNRTMYYNLTNVTKNSNTKNLGLSVRCLMD